MRGAWPAAVWGCALGIDAMISAALVYRHTHATWLAALAGAGVVATSTAALIVALGAMARSRR